MYMYDAELLEEKLQKALRANSGEEDYMLARIKFLQHQVRETDKQTDYETPSWYIYCFIS